ncbi:hypothetical protein [Colwellia psychrerythraea]|uniref:Uncharacterized protein n=1 Tax=Colwellia psychrerythraea TaxID=28229 RepID=A0A099KT88_COLPS|nr:hypothetical protein [Colwellia psychrerythraea]KGJ93984.1 hypothetical protein GAB14E_2539 [Colwellia psychrerythraea]
MALKVDLRDFLDEDGKVLALTEQAQPVFNFLTQVVLSVTKDIEQPYNDLDLKCNTRADGLTCCGHIAAKCSSIGTFSTIDWHCDTCEATGTISNWQGSIWDMQKRTMH